MVCGIASIGFDHMEILGHTLHAIAREKGGIIKPGVPALTIPQPQEILATLQQCAEEEHSHLTVLPLLPPTLTLGLDGDHQLENATLAVGLSRAVLMRQAERGAVGAKLAQQWFENDGELPAEVLVGLKETSWAGRCQQFADREAANVTYYVDGAHTDASMQIACTWFQQQLHKQHTPLLNPEALADATSGDDDLTLTPTPSLSSSSSYDVLLFNAGHVRNPFDLLQPVVQLGLRDPACQFGHFLSCPFDHDRPHLMRTPSFEQLLAQQPPPMQQFAAATSPVVVAGSTWQHTLFRVFHLLVAWHREKGEGRSMAGGAGAVGVAYAPRCMWQSGSGAAIGSVRRMAARHPKVHFRVLVCGSLYLVGNVLDKIGYRIS